MSLQRTLPILLLLSSSAMSQIRVNVGGPQYTDTSGNVWSADTGCTSTSTYTYTGAIGGTSDPTLYQTGRTSTSSLSCTYTLPTNTFYFVTLSFAEYNPSITPSDSGPGANPRLMNIFINGVRYYTAFNVRSSCGFASACDISPNPIPVGTLGSVTVVISQQAGQPMLSALSIISVGSLITNGTNGQVLTSNGSHGFGTPLSVTQSGDPTKLVETDSTGGITGVGFFIPNWQWWDLTTHQVRIGCGASVADGLHGTLQEWGCNDHNQFRQTYAGVAAAQNWHAWDTISAGTPVTPITGILANQLFGSLVGVSWDATNSWQHGPMYDQYATENWNATSHGSAHRWWTVAEGQLNQKQSMTLFGQGGLFIGAANTTDDTVSSLSVGGFTANASRMNFTGRVGATHGELDLYAFGGGGTPTVAIRTSGSGTGGGVSFHNTGGAFLFGTSTAKASGASVQSADMLQLSTQGTTAKPTCDAAHEMTFYGSGHTAGVKDVVQVCAADNTDTYAWRTIY